ncbi:ABC transporter substrate-binding protein [Intestinibacillus massiliensis]|uniref:ABC transporter substrate-binding protein n=1 Tax=Intestinibacillus massiliensis TaxID=1871029 RepID=UPI000B359E8D|nr:extracellular solute-binding protein [Intestinibacillus massiliensis]
MKRIVSICLALAICMPLAGCQPAGAGGGKPQAVTLKITTPPIGLGDVPGVGETEASAMLAVAAERFRAQYEGCDVQFEISRYNYTDEKEQLLDKIGTADAADIFFAGSWNTSAWADKGWLVPLDDIIDEGLRADISEILWNQNTYKGHVYVIPFHQLQNTLAVNKAMMERAGLDAFIPEPDTIAHWSTDDFNTVLAGLKASIADEGAYVFMMYALNSQGDSHIMTLLQAMGGSLYDENGNFAVNTPEGIAALTWLKSLDEQGYVPKGAENIELLDMVDLFGNGQLAICMANLTNLWDYRAQGLDVFPVNFPSLDGRGYAVATTNGLCVFDNGDPEKIRVAKDFIRYLYTDEEVMKYTLGTLPVNDSVMERYGDEIWMLNAYRENSANLTTIVRLDNLNWQGVRDVFYLNIQDLLRGTKTPAEVAAAIDGTCNAALEQGRSSAG